MPNKTAEFLVKMSLNSLVSDANDKLQNIIPQLKGQYEYHAA